MHAASSSKSNPPPFPLVRVATISGHVSTSSCNMHVSAAPASFGHILSVINHLPSLNIKRCSTASRLRRRMSLLQAPPYQGRLALVAMKCISSGTIQRQGRPRLIGRQAWLPSIQSRGTRSMAPWLLRQPMRISPMRKISLITCVHHAAYCNWGCQGIIRQSLI